jgi:hypothetical protein
MANYKDVGIKKISDTEYNCTDTVNAGYLNRGESLYITHNTTIELVDNVWTITSITSNYGNKNMVDDVNLPTKEIKEKSNYPEDILRARRACTRHLYALKIKIGLIEPPKEKDEFKEYIKADQYDWRKLEKVTGKLTPRRFTYRSGTFHNTPRAVEATDETIALYEFYMKKFNELEELRKNTFKKLFDK